MELITPSHYFSYFLTVSDYCFDMDKKWEEILEQLSVCSCWKKCLYLDNNYQCSHIILYSCNLRLWEEWQQLRLSIQRTYRVSQLSKLYPTYYGGRQVIARCQSLAALQRSTLIMVEPCGQSGQNMGLINCFDTKYPEIHRHGCTQAQR